MNYLILQLFADKPKGHSGVEAFLGQLRWCTSFSWPSIPRTQRIMDDATDNGWHQLMPRLRLPGAKIFNRFAVPEPHAIRHPARLQAVDGWHELTMALGRLKAVHQRALS